MKRVCFLFISILLPFPAMGDVIRVPMDYLTIQLGIDAASEQDTVLIADGIYSGDGNRDVQFHGKVVTLASENGPENCIIDCDGGLRGFTITEESPTELSWKFKGISVIHGVSGAIYVENASLILDQCIIRDNSNMENGAGICAIQSQLIVSNSHITNNRIMEYHLRDGGGIYGHSSSVVLLDTTVSNNVSHFGGGICIYLSDLMIDRCGIAGNHAHVSYYPEGGGIFAGSSTLDIRNSAFEGNRADWNGGAVSISTSGLVMGNCEMFENEGSRDGGAINVNEDSSVFLENCLIARNISGDRGSGLLLNSYSAGMLKHCSIVGNISPNGSAIQPGSASLSVINSIIWDNTPDGVIHEFIDGGDSLMITYSDIQTTSSIFPGTGNIRCDPMFVIGRDGNYYLSQISAGQPIDSPCINAGSCPARGIFNECHDQKISMADWSSRIDGGADGDIVDMGYHYESQMVPESNITQDKQLPSPPRIQRVIYVPADYETIQDGIDAAADGDTVMVADGTYSGNGNRSLSTNGKAIVVRSEHGDAHCTIDCSGGYSGFVLNTNEKDTTVIQGFTITHGMGFGYNRSHDGGGIYCYGVSPTIINCTITECSAPNTYYSTGCGGGSYFEYSSPQLIDCRFIGNYADIGSGLCSWNSSIIAVNCDITGNAAYTQWWGSAIESVSSSMTFINSIISNNTGYHTETIQSVSSFFRMDNCTISGNHSIQPLPGIIGSQFSTIVISHSIFWNNVSFEINNNHSNVFMRYSDFQGGYPGIGIIDQDPLFVAGPLGSYYLSCQENGQPLTSPCMDAGYPLSSQFCFDSTDGMIFMDELSTTSGGTGDTGRLDIGFHYPMTTPTPIPIPAMDVCGIGILIVVLGFLILISVGHVHCRI